MKTNLILTAALALTLAACAADQPQPANTATDWPKWLTDCGTAPQIPQWSYTVQASDPGAVRVPIEQWDRHVAWSIAVAAWSDCVDATRF
jgi:hypothetical protein